MRTRIVHVVEALGIGGLERVVASLTRHARLRGHEVEVVCAVAAGPVAEEIEASGVRVRVLGVRGYRPLDILAAARLLEEIDPDIVHSHGHFAGVLARSAAWWRGIAFAVHHVHTIDTTLRARHRSLERILARITRRVVCCSNAVAAHVREDLRVPADIVRVVPNGIEPAPAAGAETARAAIGGPVPPVIGCVGSLTSHKGQAVLLRAFERLPADRPVPTLVLIGDGPERATLERLARESGRGANVLFLGERRDARALLPALDLLVVPSVSREGFALVAVEAMEAGIPVIASRVGGLPEVVDDGRTGLLVPPGDPGALADALTTLLERPASRRALGDEGRHRAARFGADEMARRVEDLYEEVWHARRAA